MQRLFLLLILFTVAMVVNATITASYSLDKPLSFEQMTWPGQASERILKLSTLTTNVIQNGDLTGNSQSLALDLGTIDPITFYDDSDPSTVFDAYLGCIVYINGVEDNRLVFNSKNGFTSNILSTKKNLSGSTIKVEFYIIPTKNVVIEDSTYTINVSGLLSMDLDFWQGHKPPKPGETHTPMEIDGNTTGTQSVVPPSEVTGDHNDILDVPGDPTYLPEPDPVPVLSIDTVENPNLNITSSVKVATLFGYWQDSTATAAANITVNINPQNYVLVGVSDNTISIPYNLYMGTTLVVDTGTGHDFQYALETTNTLALPKQLSELNAKLNLTQAALNSKPAGTYTDTITITISLDS